MKMATKYKPELCASKDKSRPVLSEPHLSVEAGRVYATNGHMLCSLPVELDSTDTSGELARAALVVMRKSAAHPDNQDRTMGAIAAGAQFVEVGTQRHKRQSMGIFPDVAVVVPAADRPGSRYVCFNAGYLLKMAKAIGAASDIVILEVPVGSLEAMRVWAGESGSDVEAIAPGAAMGVLMPCMLGDGLRERNARAGLG